MTVAVDLGCHDHHVYRSLEELADKYRPDRIYGFDPHPDTDTDRTDVDGVPCVIRREAAWICNGRLRLNLDGTSSRINRAGVKVRCFDFPRWLEAHPADIVKVDVEGAEFDLLERMINVRADRHVGLLLVEWHCRTPRDRRRKARILDLLRCPVEDWWM